MYASFNKFEHNLYRDVTIVTLLDTFTSLLAGFTIFGILGHLAHELGTSDVGSVVKGGTGLAFISYPDAIAKFEWMPQVKICGRLGYKLCSVSCDVGFFRAVFLHAICPGRRQQHCYDIVRHDCDSGSVSKS